MIIATAGHVDHGKTQLVKALTGVDTDTLEEEKKRGLTINIGFAYLPVADHRAIGFIDVPGHDRFIKNALCGLSATNFVLLVIAADDGPMPQTEEHLSIIDLLGIRHGAIAISKIDRVSTERSKAVEHQTRELIKGTSLQNAPLFPISATTDTGVDALRNHLVEQSRSATNHRADNKAKHHFRLAVDRTFEINGVGLITTGTIFSGEISVDEKVIIPGTPMHLRVRGLRVQNDKAVHARARQRCAINLSGSGLRKDLIRRGSWVTSDRAPALVSRFDAKIRVLNQNTRPLAHWTPVHLHLAASEVTARVAVLEGRNIALGATGLVQIVSDEPIGAVFGDCFIIRDQSARTTLGGGQVIDISPPRRGRAKPERIAWLQAMDHCDAEQALTRLLNVAVNGVNLNSFATNRNLPESEHATVYDAVEMTVLATDESRVGFGERIWKELCDAILQQLEIERDQSPGSFGLSLPQLAKAVGSKLPDNIFKRVLDQLLRQSLIAKSAERYSLVLHQVQMSPEDEALWEAVDTKLLSAGLKPMSVAEIALETKTDKRELTAFLLRASRHCLVTRLSSALIIKPSSLVKIREVVEQLAIQNNDGIVTVPAFRESSGIGRNHTIEILEFLDSKGITTRVGDGRRLLPTAQTAFATLLKNVS
jgi:selenocysteine-specific elongation factor